MRSPSSPTGPFRSLLGAALLASALLTTTITTAGAAETILRYQFRLGGFDVAQAEVGLSLPEPGGGPYRVRSAVVADGIVGAFTSFTSRADAEGRLADGRAAPDRFRTESTWRGEDRLARLTWSDNAAPLADVTPPSDADDREPVPPHLTTGSLDPLSALLALLSDAADDGRVDAPVTVYDGRRLYSLTVDALRPGPVEAAAFTGSGWRADIRYRQLAGASRKWESRRQVTTDAHLAPSGALGLPVPVPVRITVPMQGFGALVVELTAVRPAQAADEAKDCVVAHGAAPLPQPLSPPSDGSRMTCPG